MHASQILNRLAILGISASNSGGVVELQGPCHRLTPELRQAIREAKPLLLELLPDAYAEAERWAIQHEQILPPGDWPAEFSLSFEQARRAAATGRPPAGFSFSQETMPDWDKVPPLGGLLYKPDSRGSNLV